MAEVLQCPICGAKCERKQSKRGNFYWKCEKERNHAFRDDNGSIGQNLNDRDPVPCPVCKSLCFRQASRSGNYYWRCGAMADHAFWDNDGKIGKRIEKAEKPSGSGILIFIAVLIVAFLMLWIFGH